VRPQNELNDMSQTYERDQKEKELRDFLDSCFHTPPKDHPRDEATKAEYNWSASRLWASIIYQSQAITSNISELEFSQFKTQYEEANRVTVDTGRLFERFWLRRVVGFIEIPGSMVSANFTFERIVDAKPELEFLLNYLRQNTTTTDRTTFINAVNTYNASASHKLNSRLFFSKNFLSTEKRNLKFANITEYYNGYVDHWEEIRFISALCKTKYDGNKGYQIEVDAFEKTWNSFNSIFEIPSIETFIQQGTLHRNDSKYLITLRGSSSGFLDLSSEIAANYWRLLIKDAQLGSIEDKIKIFLKSVSLLQHCWDFLSHCSRTENREFLDGAYNLIINEGDLSDESDQEYQRWMLDHSDSRFTEVHRLAERSNDLKKSDHFELLESLQLWDIHGEYFDQRSRGNLKFLIYTVLRFDPEFNRNSDNKRYARVTGLLKNSITKPFLLYFLFEHFAQARKEIISYLLTLPDFVSLSFIFIEKIKSHEHQNELTIELWRKSLEIALITIQLQTSDTQARLIFQIYRRINKDKFSIEYNRKSKHVEALIRGDRERKEKLLLELIENCPLTISVVVEKKHLIPSLFTDMTKLFETFQITSRFENGTIQFPLLQWDGLIWLMKISTYWKYKDQFTDKFNSVFHLTKVFFDSYLKVIEIEEVKKYDFFENMHIKELPSWSEKIERLGFIEWIYPVYFIYKQSLLNAFLSPRISPVIAKDRYDDKNKLYADKLRTHIGVLIRVLQKFIEPTIPYGFEKLSIKEIKDQIEQQIIAYVRLHAVHAPEEARIDLFDFHREIAFNTSENEALLPQIANAINWFTNKDGIIQAITSSKDVLKILTIAERVTSEGVRKMLIDRVGDSDLRTFLQSSHWIPEIQNVLVKIRSYPQLRAQIERVLEFWETRVVARDKKYEMQVFETKLLLAYFNGSEQELDGVVKPESQLNVRGEISTHDHVQFYRALIIMPNNPIKSHEIFNDLAARYPKYTMMALNRMAAKITIADQSNSDVTLYREALEEWNEFEKQNEEALSSVDEIFYGNKMNILLRLSEFQQLDILFDQLELPMKMLPEILGSKVESLISRKRIEDALFLIEEAERFHHFTNQAQAAFFDELRKKVKGIDNVDELKNYYARIFDSDPEKLIRVFPEKINGKIDLYEFIVKEIALSVDRMLNKIQAIANINNENKYNDLVQLALESRIGSWGWTVKDQIRKAFSATGKDAGEIDLDIQNFNKATIVTCEAFILRDVSRVQSHVEKLIGHYVHDRKALIIIVYFTGLHIDFESKWVEYRDTIIPSLNYPAGYEIDAKGLDDITKQFGYENSAIKIGKALHATSTVLYHLFINTNYVV
jgi:hypothetical protein